VADEKDLIDTINRLEKENEELQAKLNSQKRVQVITKDVIVPPPDYKQLQKDNKELEKRIAKYQKIFKNGGISDLDILITKFKETTKPQLIKIADEFYHTDYDKVQINEILKLIDYLNQTKEELYSLVTTSENGRFIINPAFRKVQNDITAITECLNQKNNILNLDEQTLEEYHQILLRVHNTIMDFIKTKKSKVS